MAKIILNVELKAGDAAKQAKAIESSLKGIASTLNSITPNQELTKQLNALARAYNAMSKSVMRSNKEQKDASVIAKNNARAELDRSRTILNNTKIQKQQTQAQQKQNKTVKEGTAENKKHNQSIGSMMTSFAKWQLVATLVMQPLNKIKSALEDIDETLVETENAVISLQRVLTDSIPDKEIADRLYHIAQAYGQTFENVNTIAQNFARTGMSWTDTIRATEAAVIALNVAELDAEQASDGMIAILTQFGAEASDLMLIVDKLNKTADRAAVTTEKLLKALTRVGSTAVQSGLDLDETISLITALSVATGRSGENIGTALNALLNYSSKDSALETFASLSDNTANVVEEFKKGGVDMLAVWRAVSQEISHLTDQQADLLDNYFKTEEGAALADELGAELGDIYNDLSGVYSTANTFRKNYFIALLQNMDEVDKAMGNLQGAAGYSQKENEQYMDSYTAKVATLQAKWQELANDEQGWLQFKKGLVEIGIEILNLIDNVGGLRTVIEATAVAATSAITAISAATKSNPTLAAISAIAGAIGLAVVAIQAFNREANEAYEAVYEAQDNWSSMANDALKFSQAAQAFYDLADSTDYTKEQSEEFLSVQQSVVNLLGEEVGLLSKLEKGTERYTERVKELTAARLNSFVMSAYASAIEAENNFKNRDVIDNDIYIPIAMAEYGIPQYQEYLKLHGSFFTGTNYQVDPSKTTAIEQYLIYGELARLTQQYINEEFIKGNDAEEEKKAFLKVQKAAETAKSYAEEYITAMLTSDIYNAMAANGGAISREEADKIVNNFFSSLPEGAAEAFSEVVQKVVVGFFGIEKAADDAGNGVENKIKSWSDRLKDVVDKLKEAKNELAEADTLQSKQNALLEAQLKLQEAITQARKDYIEGVLDEYVKDVEQATTLEEKQNAILEARQRLLEAQKQRNVRVYNASTGLWEWQADQKEIVNAQEDLQDSIDDLHKYLKNQAVNELKEAIEAGNTSAANISSILNKWLSLGEGGELLIWGNELAAKLAEAVQSGYYDSSKIESAQQSVYSAQRALSDYWAEKLWDEVIEASESGAEYSKIQDILDKYAGYGVDPSIIATIRGIIDAEKAEESEHTDMLYHAAVNAILGNIYKRPQASTPNGIYDVPAGGDSDVVMKTYDNGGILQGLGGIKATAQPETVLDPELTAKILSPVSNQRFSDFATSLGLLFGVSASTPSRSPVVSTANATTNHNNNYTINGVPISTEAAQRYTVAELFGKMQLFGNSR